MFDVMHSATNPTLALRSRADDAVYVKILLVIIYVRSGSTIMPETRFSLFGGSNVFCGVTLHNILNWLSLFRTSSTVLKKCKINIINKTVVTSILHY